MTSVIVYLFRCRHRSALARRGRCSRRNRRRIIITLGPSSTAIGRRAMRRPRPPGTNEALSVLVRVDSDRILTTSGAAGAPYFYISRSKHVPEPWDGSTAFRKLRGGLIVLRASVPTSRVGPPSSLGVPNCNAMHASPAEPSRLATLDLDFVVVVRRLLHGPMPRLLHRLLERHAPARRLGQVARA